MKMVLTQLVYLPDSTASFQVWAYPVLESTMGPAASGTVRYCQGLISKRPEW
jgi:hypothetical protein